MNGAWWPWSMNATYDAMELCHTNVACLNLRTPAQRTDNVVNLGASVRIEVRFRCQYSYVSQFSHQKKFVFWGDSHISTSQWLIDLNLYRNQWEKWSAKDHQRFQNDFNIVQFSKIEWKEKLAVPLTLIAHLKTSRLRTPMIQQIELKL